MKKILIASHAAVLEVNRALFQELQKLNKFQVSMVVPKTWNGDLISGLSYRENKEENIAVYPLPVAFSGNGSLFYYKGDLSKVLKKTSPDLLIIDEEPWSLAAAQLVWSSGAAKKVFYTKQNLKKSIPLPFKLLQKWIFNHSVAALSVEKEVEDVLRWKGFDKKIFDLPHSYDPLLFSKISMEEKAKHRSALGLKSNSLVFMYCGRLSADKGIEDLLTAIADLENRTINREIEFLIVGNGALASNVKSFAERKSKIKVVLQEAIPHHLIGRTMGLADVLLLPSRTMANWKEQFGRVLVEGMACGLAVIGSDSGAIERVIQRCGGGLVFPEGNIPAFTDAILDLSNNPEKLNAFREKGFSYVTKHLTHQAQAKNLAGFISEILL